ncbi:AGAP008524-PA, partial [Anopheles gambiae str. PEST]
YTAAGFAYGARDEPLPPSATILKCVCAKCKVLAEKKRERERGSEKSADSKKKPCIGIKLHHLLGAVCIVV